MPQTLADWLSHRFPAASRQTLKRMAAAGRVRVNGRPARRLDTPVGEGEAVTVLDRAAAEPPAGGAGKAGKGRPDWAVNAGRGRLTIVYEDQDLIVVDKPAGLLTSTVAGERRPTLLARVREHVEGPGGQDGGGGGRRRGPRAGLIHRLDRDAAGLLVFSKNDPAYQSLKSQFFHHDVERVYAAVVHGIPDPPAGRIESRLVERADGSVYSTGQPGKGQAAVTHYETVRSAGGVSLLRVTLHTGRKHQIRAHLSQKGWPIVGDVVYGKADRPTQRGRAGNGPGERLLLAAVRLAFTHPRTGERVTFEVPPPEAMATAHDPSGHAVGTSGGAVKHIASSRRGRRST
jgi:23S rRNA pseudouridine1911/1915/1917 synthase